MTVRDYFFNQLHFTQFQAILESNTVSDAGDDKFNELLPEKDSTVLQFYIILFFFASNIK